MKLHIRLNAPPASYPDISLHLAFLVLRDTRHFLGTETEKTETTEHSANQSGNPQPKGKSVLLIGDSMIKAIEEQRLSTSQSFEKICLGGAKITAIKDQLTPELRHNTYDSVIIHAGTI